MINDLIRFSVKNKFAIIMLVLGLIGWGSFSLSQLPIDAVPDITNNQVQVVTISPSLAPQEVEQYITFPVELAMGNLPEVQEIRSVSKYGLSVVTIVFDEGLPMLDARQLVSEQIGAAASEIPPGMGTPQMMPITTGLGEIYQYTIEPQPGYEGQYDATELRTIQDWIVKRYLTGIDGIVEISSFGGFVKQYEVSLDPGQLRALDVTVDEVYRALAANNANSGGSYIEQGQGAFYIRSEGLVRGPEEIEGILVKRRQGVPVRVRDLAEVRIGHMPRYGAMTANGQGEAVGGITLMLKGANSSEVIERVQQRVAEVQSSLSEGLRIEPYLDRSDLVGRAIRTVRNNLVEGGLIVIFVLVLLLGNLRGGLIVASVIPLALMFAFGMMHAFGVSANLMSLGALDFGLIVDGAVIVVEGVVHRLQQQFSGQKLSREAMDEEVIRSSSRLMRSAVFGEIIILMVYLPILALEGVEGKMFVPMAQTVGFAILGALILSVTYVPMAASLFLSRQPKEQVTLADRIIGALRRGYAPLLRWALRSRALVVGLAFAAFVGAMALFNQLGGEFIPSLEEGDLAMQMTIPPGSALSQTVAMSSQAEAILLENFPEVEKVVSKIGTAEVPTDPMSVEDADVMIIMRPKDQWTTASDRETLVSLMKEALAPLEAEGAAFEFTQPIELRFNELLTGAKSDIAVKIYGEDLGILADKGEEAAGLISQIQGAGDVRVARTEGFPQIEVKLRRDQLAAYGLSVAEVNQVLHAAFAGGVAGTVFEGERRFDLVVRFRPDYRQRIDDLSSLYLRSADGQQVPLTAVADIQFNEGPMLISRDDTRRQVTVGVNVRNRDVESLVEEIQQTLEQQLSLPPGYAIRYGGEFEQLESARQRLSIAVPAVLLMIFALLYLAFNSVRQALMIYTAIPLAAIGGVLALWLRGLPFSISAGVGFIALFGVAVLNGIVLISYFNQLKEEGYDDLQKRIMLGASIRLRPVLMTASVASLGFLPMAISTTAGAEVQRPLATVVIGGLVTSTLLTLLVLPVLYRWVEGRAEKRRAKKNQQPPQVPQHAGVILLLLLPLAGVGQDTLSLSQAQERMLSVENQPLLRQDRLSVEQALAARQRALTLGPTQFSFQRGQIDGEAIDNSFSITQSLGQPFTTGAQRSLADKQAFARQQQVALTAHSLMQELEQVYLRWQWLQAQSQTLDSLAQFYQRLAKVAQVRFEAGETDNLAQLSAQSEQQRLSLERRSIEAQRAELLQRFRLLLFTEEDVWPEAQPLSVWAPPAPVAVSHPALQQQEAETESVAAQVRLEKARLSPALSAGYWRQSLDNVAGFDGWQVGLSLPLADRSQWQAIEVAELAEAQAQEQLRYLNQRFARESATLQAQLRLQQERLAYFTEQALPQAERLRQTAQARYEQGAIDYLTFARLLRQAFDLQLQYQETIFQHNLLVLQLRYLADQPDNPFR